MTNKLRSVIEEILNSFSPENHSAHHQDASRYSMSKLLDAIIEDIEQDKMNLFNTIKQPFDFDKGLMEALRNTLNKLKQAREELSTSLTQ